MFYCTKSSMTFTAINIAAQKPLTLFCMWPNTNG